MDGFQHLAGYLSFKQQMALLREIKKISEAAPFYYPTMPKTGKPFSVQETNCGSLGWVSDKDGYRYQQNHPKIGTPWPKMPESFKKIWQDLSGMNELPEAGLINYYTPKARMGLHQDKDEQEFAAPVISISLGLSAKFRIGGLKRRDKTRSITLNSGDVIVMGGPSRLCYHGIDRIIDDGKAEAMSGGDFEKITGLERGRLNITLRRVMKLSI